MKFAKVVFLVAGVYGLLALVPMYFAEARFGRDYPPPVTHPEFYYGFLGVATAWQLAFLVISRDPVRYRPLMIPAVLEKLIFGVATPVLYAQGRAASVMLAGALLDLVLCALFAAAYLKTPARELSER